MYQQSQETSSSFLGSNSLFFSCITYILATALQEADIRVGLIVGTISAGFIVVIGLILFFTAERRIPLYLLDSILLISLAVQLGVSYKYKEEIARCFNFITNASLTGLATHVREAVPRGTWRHPLVIRMAYITSALCVLAFTINTMIYLVPIAEDVWWDRKDPLTAIFKVFLPCIIYVSAIIATRLMPVTIIKHLQESQGFNGIQAIGVVKVPGHV